MAGTASKIRAAQPAPTATADSVAVEPRRRGRPSKRDAEIHHDQVEVSRALIIEHATRLSREESLDDISLVRLAKELAVTPATVHYHLQGGRDELLSEVVTTYMQHIVHCFERAEGEWDARLRTVAYRLFKVHIEFKGVNAYLMSHNKFRLLQTSSKGEQDLGVRYLDRFIALFRERGYDNETCIIYVHQMAFFIASCAHAEIRRQLPAHHQRYLTQEFSSRQLLATPDFAESLDEFMHFDAEKMFFSGIDILLRGFSTPAELKKLRRKQAS